MTTITLKGIYDNGIIKSIDNIKIKPDRIYIVLDYSNDEILKNDQNQIIDLNNIVGVIDKDFKNDYEKYLLNKYS